MGGVNRCVTQSEKARQVCLCEGMELIQLNQTGDSCNIIISNSQGLNLSFGGEYGVFQRSLFDTQIKQSNGLIYSS